MTRRKTLRSIHSKVYLILYALGIVSAGGLFLPWLWTQFRQMSVGDLGSLFAGLAAAFITIFVLFNFAHLGFAYLDFYRMEEIPGNYRKLFPGFFGTKADRRIRVAAFICLLIAGGKVSSLVGLVHDYSFTHRNIEACNAASDCLSESKYYFDTYLVQPDSLVPPRPERCEEGSACIPIARSYFQFERDGHWLKLFLFLLFNLLVFVGFFTWDCFALRGISTTDPHPDARTTITTYLKSDALAMTFWGGFLFCFLTQTLSSAFLFLLALPGLWYFNEIWKRSREFLQELREARKLNESSAGLPDAEDRVLLQSDNPTVAGLVADEQAVDLTGPGNKDNRHE